MVEEGIQENEIANNQPQARESWVNAFEEGNRLMPQTHGSGIALLTLASILRDPPEKWEDFSKAKLTETQLKRIGRNMSRMHKNASVGVATAEHAVPDVKIIPDKTLEGVWSRDKQEVQKAVVAYINQTRAGRNETLIAPETIEEWDHVSSQIDSFFANPENIAAASRMKDIIKVAESSLLDESSIPLIKFHRRAVTQAPRQVEVDRRHLEESKRGRLAKMLLPKHMPQYYPPKFMASNMLARRINDAVGEIFPEEDLSWMQSSVTSQSTKRTHS